MSCLPQCCSLSSRAPAAAQCVTAALARPRMSWPFATPLTSFLPQSFCSGCPGLFAVSQAAGECLSECSAFVLPSALNPSSKMHPGSHRARPLFHHKLPLAFYLQCLHWPLSRQFLFMHSPFCYPTVLFLVYC